MLTASVPLLFGSVLVGAGSAGQVSVPLRCAFLARILRRDTRAEVWGRNSSSAPLRRPGPRGLATLSMGQPLATAPTALSASRLRMHSVFCFHGDFGNRRWQVPFLLSQSIC